MACRVWVRRFVYELRVCGCLSDFYAMWCAEVRLCFTPCEVIYLSSGGLRRLRATLVFSHVSYQSGLASFLHSSSGSGELAGELAGVADSRENRRATVLLPAVELFGLEP